MNKKDLYAVLKDKTRIAWVEVFTDPEAGDGLRVWFEDWRGLEFYRSKATFVKWLEEWDIVSTAAAEKAALILAEKSPICQAERSSPKRAKRQRRRQ